MRVGWFSGEDVRFQVEATSAILRRHCDSGLTSQLVSHYPDTTHTWDLNCPYCHAVV